MSPFDEHEVTGASSGPSLWVLLVIGGVLALIVWISNTNYRVKKFWHMVAGAAIIFTFTSGAYELIVRLLR